MKTHTPSRHWRLSPALALTLAAFLLQGGIRAAEPPQPLLRLLPSNSVDVGSIRSYGITNVPFRIRNEGAAPLLIERLVPTCPCIRGTLERTGIPAGQEALLTVALDAAQVHGLFKRGLWVHSNDPESPHVAISLTGSVIPLFAGLPARTVILTAEHAGAALTNLLTLTATETNLFLGTPKVETLGDLGVALTLATNLGETASYRLTTVFTPRTDERHNATITLPVSGGQRPEPLEIYFRVLAGAALMTVPRQIAVPPGTGKQAFRLTIRAKGMALEAENLTWEPAAEGLKMTAAKARRGRDLVVTGEISRETVRALLPGDPPEIRFSYPGLKPAAVTFSVEKESSAEQQP